VEASFTMHLGRTGEAYFLGEEVHDGSIPLAGSGALASTSARHRTASSALLRRFELRYHAVAACAISSAACWHTSTAAPTQGSTAAKSGCGSLKPYNLETD